MTIQTTMMCRQRNMPIHQSPPSLLKAVVNAHL